MTTTTATNRKQLKLGGQLFDCELLANGFIRVEHPYSGLCCLLNSDGSIRGGDLRPTGYDRHLICSTLLRTLEHDDQQPPNMLQALRQPTTETKFKKHQRVIGELLRDACAVLDSADQNGHNPNAVAKCDACFRGIEGMLRTIIESNRHLTR